MVAVSVVFGQIFFLTPTATDGISYLLVSGFHRNFRGRLRRRLRVSFQGAATVHHVQLALAVELRPRRRAGQPVVHTDNRDQGGRQDELQGAHDQHAVLYLLQTGVEILQRVAGRQGPEGELRAGHAVHQRHIIQHVYGVRQRALFTGRAASSSPQHGGDRRHTYQTPKTHTEGDITNDLMDRTLQLPK